MPEDRGDLASVPSAEPFVATEAVESGRVWAATEAAGSDGSFDSWFAEGGMLVEAMDAGTSPVAGFDVSRSGDLGDAAEPVPLVGVGV